MGEGIVQGDINLFTEGIFEFFGRLGVFTLTQGELSAKEDLVRSWSSNSPQTPTLGDWNVFPSGRKNTEF